MSEISKFSCILKTPEEMLGFAAELAGLCKTGDSILLYGDVGVGKTTFARGFIQAIAKTREEIVSPTFTLVQTYPLMNGGMVWHCDLYRLKNQNELIELGLDEAFDNAIVLIEWPEIAASQFPHNSLSVRLDIRTCLESRSGEARTAVFENRTASVHSSTCGVEAQKTLFTASQSRDSKQVLIGQGRSVIITGDSEFWNDRLVKLEQWKI